MTDTPDSTQQLLSLYPALAGLPELLPRLPLMTVPAGTALFEENQACQGFPMVIRGEVRVSRSGANGRALELYRVRPGEMCLVSSASLFAGQPLSAHGVATGPTTLALLSPADFDTALADASFRGYVLGLFAERMADLTALIDAVAFQQLDSRLAAALLGHGAQVRATHQTLADELGTVREIVTRLLHRFEREGLVELSRECITIRNSAGLRAAAALIAR
ncbi:Crp/Fnr family transcriptional regulator [Hydrogenophaga sp. PAMC20947]|uniref:Crp/Fnr family transcriptional regulator n=1 Tax=Hydrogenophaga sp. PAMC20947 TaxID=2565558 RepID=UPI00109D8DAE|nr:Crp/Fnr family transcriptional regulator [Hydrogenophaga sp. PAMC20947]QCB47574.1 Crp/Fnr family transcriptional regulator [Hydrogenophaga sp. PAMC20947]